MTVSAVALLLAHALDGWTYQHVVSPQVYERDCSALLAYLVVWGLAKLLHPDAARQTR